MKKCHNFEEMKDTADRFGYEPIVTIENHVKWIFNFKKSDRHVWQCIDRRMGGIVWQTADLIGGKYCNHQKFIYLEEALSRK